MSDDPSDRVIEAIVAGLALGPDDDLLHLCGGDARIGRALAARCRNVHTVAGPDPDALSSPDGRRFNKVLLYEGLDGLSPFRLQGLLERLLPWMTPDCRLFLGAIGQAGDRSRGSWTGRPLRSLLGRFRGPATSDRVWSGEELCRVLGNVGLYCSFVEGGPRGSDGGGRLSVIATRDGAPLRREKAVGPEAATGATGDQRDGAGGV